jgi:hypothetical protein
MEIVTFFRIFGNLKTFLGTNTLTFVLILCVLSTWDEIRGPML